MALAYSGSVIPSNRMNIPETVYNGEIIQNLVNSYPITLDGFSCLSKDLNACIALKASGTALTSGCCTALYDISIDPIQTITSPLVIFIGVIIPFIVFIIRSAVWRIYISRKSSSTSVSHINPSCSTYFSPRYIFLWLFSVAPETLEVLYRLHYFGDSGGIISNNWDSSGDVRKQKRSLKVDPDHYQQEGGNIIGMEGAGDGNDESRYEILDSHGNTIKSHRVEDRRDVRDGDVGDRVERGEYDSSPQSNDVLHESFLRDSVDATAAITPPPSPLQHMFWLLLLYEPSFALAVSSIAQAIICLGLKRYVGEPRPNYYALTAWSSVYPSDRMKEAESARMSFPSGHAATAAGGLVLLILVLLTDIKYLRRKHKRMRASSTYIGTGSVGTGTGTGPGIEEPNDERHCSHLTDTVFIITFFSLLIFLSVCLVLWVGGSRIKDYFHFPGDVVGASRLNLLY